MKVLDPQSALLTTAEVHQFLQDKPARKNDKKIGSYPVVNLHNYNSVRSDFDNYIKLNHPQVLDYEPVDTFTNELLRRLKPYDLTKAEVFSLINLGVGVTDTQISSKSDADADVEAEAEAEAEAKANGSNAEEPAESDLPRSLFRLIVEESEQRFEGDAGEQRITEILAILKETTRTNTGNSVAITNGHHAEDAARSNGVS